ncbi:MAG: EFR1 family ferrodoxin [Peptostreptococcus sp.]|uniref:EFR1 family ferrodoxin n=1 Tax=Peptostreptococcus sp. TaxID=1262 RepID=UPI002FCBF19C
MMILYFTGTGNSKYVAKRIADATGESMKSISKYTGKPVKIELEEGEKLGIVTPTYFGGLPSIVREFFERIEINMFQNKEKLEYDVSQGYIVDSRIKNNETEITEKINDILSYERPYTYFVATYGGFSGQIEEYAKEYLDKRNIHIDAAYGVKMVDNWSPLSNVGNKEKNNRINEKAEDNIDEIISMIKSKEEGSYIKNKIPEFIVSKIYPKYEKARKTSNLRVEKSCIGCGICEEKCPMNAIKLSEFMSPIWIKDDCAMCLRCLHSCPTFSIQYKNKTEKHGQYINPNISV